MSDIPPSTVTVFQSLAVEALGATYAQIPVTDSVKVTVTVEPPGTYWFIEEAMIQELRGKGMLPVPANGDMHVECAVKDAHVKYTNVRRDGLLGSRLVDRTTALVLWLRISSSKQGQYLVDKEWRSERTDTVAVDLVDRLENPSISATRAALPPEGFFSSWLEPLIVVGAVGVAVLLLFTIRS